jgi:TP901 family phage tail tape measure protein
MRDVAELGLEVDSRQIRQANRELDGFSGSGKKAAGAAGVAKKAFGGMALAVGAAVGAMASLGAAVSVIREFESSMSQVAAITRATASELESMRDIAKELGSTTEFSAAQAADGLKFLGMAGFTATESIKALPAVLDLATAAGLGLGQAADTASNIMSGFGIAAENASVVSDVLAAAASRANTDVSQLGSAMSTVAPIAAALEIDLADTAAAIGILSDAGIQGSRAGTALRGVMASLAGPTTQARDVLKSYGLTAADIDPQTHGLAGAMQALGAAGINTADAMTLFGREAASGALVLIDAGDRVSDFGDELRDTKGAASEMAAIMRDNLAGDALAAKSALEGLAIALGEAGLTYIIRGALVVVTGFARELTALTAAVSEFFTKHDPIEAAVIAAADAMNQEARQALQLSNRLLEMGKVSYDVLGSKIALIETSLRAIDVARQEAVAQSMLSERYLQAANTAGQARDVISTYQNLISSGMGMSDEDLASYQDWIGKLQTAVAVQTEIVEAAGLVGPEYDKAVAELDLLKAYLRDASGETVLLGENTEDVVDSMNRVGESAFSAGTAAGRLASQLSAAASAAMQVANNLAAAPAGIQGFQNRAAQLTAQINAIDSGYGVITAGAEGYRKELEQQYGLADAANVAEDVYISGLINRQVEEYTNVQNLNKAYSDKVSALNAVGTAAGGGSKTGGAAGGLSKAAKSAKDLADELERMELDADPVKKYNSELATLNGLLDAGLSDGAYNKQLDKLNDGLADQLPLVNDVADAWGEWMASGFKDFDKFTDSILSSFKNLLVQMISTAARNKILIGLGVGSSGIGGAAAAATGGSGGLLSTLTGGGSGGGGLLSSISGLGGAFASGFSNTIAATFGAGGGLMSGIASAGAQVGTALAGGSVASIGAAVGAVAPYAIAAYAAFKFLKGATKREYASSGYGGTLGGGGIQTEYQLRHYKGGYLSSGKTGRFDWLPPEMSSGLQSAVASIRSNTLEMADSLGLATNNIDNFAAVAFGYGHAKDAFDQAALDAEFQRALSAVADGMAGALFNSAPFAKEGETAALTLQRLATSLNGVNTIFATLDRTLMDVSLTGAATASQLVDAFGTLEAMVEISSGYYQNFYSEAERVAHVTRDLTSSFADLGFALPTSRDAFRALVESIDITTEAGATLYASVLSLSGGLSTILPAFDAVTDATRQLVKDLLNDAQLAASSYAQKAARGGMNVEDAIEAAKKGDINAVREYLRVAQEGSGSHLEYRGIASKVLSQLGVGGGASLGSTEDLGAAAVSAQVRDAQAARNDMLEKGLVALQAEMAGLRQENRDLLLRADRFQKEQANTLARWEAVGMPKERA